MDVPQPMQYESYQDRDEEFRSPGLFCGLQKLIYVLAKYILYGAFTAAIVYHVPTYGSALSNDELLVIGAVVAGVVLIGERIIPDYSYFALR